MLNGLKNFMRGRYGVDRLNIWLLIISIILMLVSRFTNIVWLSLVGYLPLVICVFRFLSKNVTKRYDENYKLLKICAPVENFFKGIPAWFRKKQKYIAESKFYHHWQCPKCKQKLKVPKGRGMLEIDCPKCHTKFKRKS